MLLALLVGLLPVGRADAQQKDAQYKDTQQKDTQHKDAPHKDAQSKDPQRKKVGVVLGGGGAKGVAHISVLKVIEEAGVPIDYIAGTSMGAIIGGLYAMGYDTGTLDSLVRAQNWQELLSDFIPRSIPLAERESRETYVLTVPLTRQRRLSMPSGIMSGNNVYNLLTQMAIDYHEPVDFNTLPIPFACVAYDLVTGKAVTLDHGYLNDAIRASMSIPGAFDPVRMDSMVLIDGGIANNFPVDVAKKMGADIIIGVDLAGKPKGTEGLNSLTDMLTQITWHAGVENYDANRAMVDIYIHPDVEGYNSGSFSTGAVDSLIVRGERAAREKFGELTALRDTLCAQEEYIPSRRISPDYMNQNLEIGDIVFEGNNAVKEKHLRQVSGLMPNSVISSQQISHAISRLQGLASLDRVSYRLESHNPYKLIISVKESTRNSASLGVRFDTEEMAAILLNVRMAPRWMRSSHIDVTGRLNENPYVRGSFIATNETQRKLALSYKYQYNDIDQYTHGEKGQNVDFHHHTIDLNYANIRLRNFVAGVGMRWEYYDYDSWLSTENFSRENTSAPRHKFDRLISYYAGAQYESFDRHFSPRSGMSFKANYTLYTTNFATNDGHTPYSSIQVRFLTALSISKRMTFLPGLFGRVLIGDGIAYPVYNFIGGTVDGRYFEHQMAFTGVGHYEAVRHSILGARLDLRIRLWTKHFLSLKGNYARENDNFWRLWDPENGKDIWGVGINYTHNTIVGPIEAQVGYSNRTKSVNVYFNLGYYF